MRFLAVIGATVLLIAVGATIYFVGGLYSIGADDPHWGITEQALQLVRTRSVAKAAGSNEGAMPNLEDAAMARKGAANYAEMCAGCHRAPGAPESLMRQGLYPKPPDFTSARVEPAAAFWIIKHGLKMTGMPAWGASHDDATIWAMVGFLRRLPGMAKADYDALVQSAPREEAMPGGHAHGTGPAMSPAHREVPAGQTAKH